MCMKTRESGERLVNEERVCGEEGRPKRLSGLTASTHQGAPKWTVDVSDQQNFHNHGMIVEM